MKNSGAVVSLVVIFLVVLLVFGGRLSVTEEIVIRHPVGNMEKCSAEDEAESVSGLLENKRYQCLAARLRSSPKLPFVPGLERQLIGFLNDGCAGRNYKDLESPDLCVASINSVSAFYGTKDARSELDGFSYDSHRVWIIEALNYPDNREGVIFPIIKMGSDYDRSILIDRFDVFDSDGKALVYFGLSCGKSYPYFLGRIKKEHELWWNDRPNVSNGDDCSN